MYCFVLLYTVYKYMMLCVLYTVLIFFFVFYIEDIIIVVFYMTDNIMFCNVRSIHFCYT